MSKLRETRQAVIITILYLLAVAVYDSLADGLPTDPPALVSEKSLHDSTKDSPIPQMPQSPKTKDGKFTGPMSDFELAAFQYCGNDRDCVKANNGCCDCANGGADVAINRERMEQFKASFDCLDLACTEMGMEPPCGSGVVSCVNHGCRYFDSQDFGPRP